MRFADANIFLRFLAPPTTAVDRERSDACADLFARVTANEEDVVTAESVISDVYYVLTSRHNYGLDPIAAATRIESLLRLTGINVPNKQGILRALHLVQSHPFLDFTDAVIVSTLEKGPMALLSYDAHFDRIPGIARVEP